MLLMAPGLHRPGLSLKLHPSQSEKMSPLSLLQYSTFKEKVPSGYGVSIMPNTYQSPFLTDRQTDSRTTQAQNPLLKKIFGHPTWHVGS